MAAQLPSVFERYRTAIDAEIRSIFEGRDFPLYDFLRYHLGWVDEQGRPTGKGGGKALRPTLCLFACQALGGDYRAALPAAAAIELVHNFSLIHDDIQDGDRERRHRPTVWWLWGKAQAINAGTAMRVLASLALSHLDGGTMAPGKQLEAGHLLDRSCLEMIEGQYLDLSYEDRLDIALDAYLEMIARKTGALIGCSLQMGALLGTDEAAAVERFARCGRKLGLAFQIRDDVLGIWGDQELTGKPLAADIRRKKKSLPTVFALEQASGHRGEQMRAILAQETLAEEDVISVLGILEELGARELAQGMARRYHQQALEEIEGTDLSPSARREFEELATFLVERDY